MTAEPRSVYELDAIYIEVTAAEAKVLARAQFAEFKVEQIDFVSGDGQIQDGFILRVGCRSGRDHPHLGRITTPPDETLAYGWKQLVKVYGARDRDPEADACIERLGRVVASLSEFHKKEDQDG